MSRANFSRYSSATIDCAPFFGEPRNNIQHQMANYRVYEFLRLDTTRLSSVPGSSSEDDILHCNSTLVLRRSGRCPIWYQVLAIITASILFHMLLGTVHAHGVIAGKSEFVRRQSVAPKLVDVHSSSPVSSGAALIHHTSMPFPIKVILNDTIVYTLNNNTKLETTLPTSTSSSTTSSAVAKKPSKRKIVSPHHQQKQRASRGQKRQRATKPSPGTNSAVTNARKRGATTGPAAAKVVKNTMPVAIQQKSAVPRARQQRSPKWRHHTPTSSPSTATFDNRGKSAALLAESPNTGVTSKNFNRRGHKAVKSGGHGDSMHKQTSQPLADKGGVALTSTIATIVEAKTLPIRQRSSAAAHPSVHVAHSTIKRRNYHAYKPSEIRILQPAEHHQRGHLLTETTTPATFVPPAQVAPKRSTTRNRKRTSGGNAAGHNNNKSAALVTVVPPSSSHKLFGTHRGIHGSSVITREPAIVKDVDYVAAEFLPEPADSQLHTAISTNINVEPPLASIAAAPASSLNDNKNNADNFNVWEPAVTLAPSTTEVPLEWTHSTRYRPVLATTVTPLPASARSTTSHPVDSLQWTYKTGSVKTTTTTTTIPPPLDVSFSDSGGDGNAYFGVHNQPKGSGGSSNKNNNSYFGGGVSKSGSSGSAKKGNNKSGFGKTELNSGRNESGKKSKESVFPSPSALEQQVSMARNAAQRVKSEMYSRYGSPTSPQMPRPPHAPPLLESPALNVPPDDAPLTAEPPPPRSHGYTSHHWPNHTPPHGPHRRRQRQHMAPFSHPPSPSDPYNFNLPQSSPPIESFLENGGNLPPATTGPVGGDYGVTIDPNISNGGTGGGAPSAGQMSFLGDLGLLALSGILEEVLPEMPKATAETAAAAFGFSFNGGGAKEPPPPTLQLPPPPDYYERNYWRNPPHSSPSNSPEASPKFLLPLVSENNNNNNNNNQYPSYQYQHRQGYHPQPPPHDGQQLPFYDSANGQNRQKQPESSIEGRRYTPPHWYP